MENQANKTTNQETVSQSEKTYRSIPVLEKEKEDRALYKSTINRAFYIVYVLCVTLIIWVAALITNNIFFLGIDYNVAWHIAFILVLPATTILFMIIRSVANKDKVKETKMELPQQEFMSQLIQYISEIINAIKGK